MNRQCIVVASKVARHYGVTVAEMVGRSRSRTIAEARNVCWYVLRVETSLSFPEIGRLFGGRDNSTIVAGVRRVRTLLLRGQLTDVAMARRIDAILVGLRREIEWVTEPTECRQGLVSARCRGPGLRLQETA